MKDFSSAPRVFNAVNDVYDNQAVVSYSKKRNLVVLAFRGTVATSLVNWWENLKFFQLPYNPNEYGAGVSCPNCQVHRGFLQSYQNLRQKTGFIDHAKNLLRNECKGCKVLITGHSLGGALATLAAFENWGTSVQFINFGSPRVGNTAFEQAFKGRINSGATRVTHASDLVTRLPLQNLGYQY